MTEKKIAVCVCVMFQTSFQDKMQVLSTIRENLRCTATLHCSIWDEVQTALQQDGAALQVALQQEGLHRSMTGLHRRLHCSKTGCITELHCTNTQMKCNAASHMKFEIRRKQTNNCLR